MTHFFNQNDDDALYNYLRCEVIASLQNAAMPVGMKKFMMVVMMVSSIRGMICAPITTMMILIVSKAMTIRHTSMLTVGIGAEAVIVTEMSKILKIITMVIKS